MLSRRECLKLIATSVVAAPAFRVSPLRAAQWPQRTVRLIVPASAASGTDFAARTFADALAARWKQPVVVENRPGADGLIATTAFLGMYDDHAMMYSFAGPMSLLPVIHASLSYDPRRDLVPISLGADTFVAFSAHASLNLGSLKEFVALARSQPGKFNYYAPSGALPYLLAGFLKSQNLDLVQIYYREQSRGLQDHAEGRIPFMLSVMTDRLPVVQSGHVNFLAVTNGTRAAMRPDVPTAVESGFPEFAFDGLAGFIGSRAMSADVIDRISIDVRAVAADHAVSDRLAVVGQLARGTTPAEFLEMIESQRAKIATIVQETGLRPQH
jgi:tripartite-type tricarboxylate transporter receptor subunit TctC